MPSLILTHGRSECWELIPPSKMWNCSTLTRQVARIGGNGVVAFTDCTFDEWSHNNDLPAITAASGSLLIRGCDFRQNSPHVLLQEGVERAVIAGNLFHGPAQIENLSKRDVQIALNVASS